MRALILTLVFVTSQVYSTYEDIEWDTDSYWFDTFPGTTLSNKWENGRKENKNKHYQHYENKNVIVDNGLTIETYYEIGKQDKGDGKEVPYASGAITTEGVANGDFIYPVRIEVLARLPMYNLHLPTLHTAIWLQRTGGDPTGVLNDCYQEYDIMEAYDDFRANRVTAAYHFNIRKDNKTELDIPPDHPCYWDITTYKPSLQNLFQNYDNESPNEFGKTNDGYYPFKNNNNDYDGHYFSNDGNWHNWTLEWLKDRVTLYIDQVKVSNITDLDARIPYQPMGLIINTAICDKESWCGKHEPNWDESVYYNTDETIIAKFLIKSVHAYKPAWDFEPFWYDDFSGTSLDTNKWSYETSIGSNEAQHYEINSVVVNNGLTIESFYSVSGGSNFQSGGIISTDEFQYPVKIEISMKLPDYNLIYPTVHPHIYFRDSDSVGTQPRCYQQYEIMGQYNDHKSNKIYAKYTFNKVGTTWSTYADCGAQETTYLPTINNYLFMSYGNSNNNYQYYPMSNDPLNRNPPGWSNNGNGFSDDYHKFTFEWLEDSITLKMDDRIISQVTSNDGVYMPFQPMKLYISMPVLAQTHTYDGADSNDWAQNDASVKKKFDIEYIKVYSKPGVTPYTPSPPPPAGKVIIHHELLSKNIINDNNGYFYGLSNILIIFILTFIFIFMLCIMIASAIYIYKNIFKNKIGNIKYAKVTFDEKGDCNEI
eukprot:290213_1